MSKPRTDSRWHIVPTLVVLGAGLAVVIAVWLLSCIWSFGEQTRAARNLGFEHPHVLPWMLDALAAALALVALAAALAGQSAGLARLGVFLALAGSVWANTAGVSIRSGGDPKHDAVAMAAIAPVSAFVALEVLLGKIRRLVLWLRGEEPPVAVPPLRFIRVILKPTAFGEWRAFVLELTAPKTGVSTLPGDAAGPEDTSKISSGPVPTTTDGATPGATGPGAVVAPPASPGPAPLFAEGAGSDPGTAGRERTASHGQSSSSPAPEQVPASTSPRGAGTSDPGRETVAPGRAKPLVHVDHCDDLVDWTTVDHRDPGHVVQDQQDHSGSGRGPVDQGQGSTAEGHGPVHVVNLDRLTEDQLVDHYLTRAKPVLTMDQLAARLQVHRSTAKRRVNATRKARETGTPLRVVR